MLLARDGAWRNRGNVPSCPALAARTAEGRVRPRGEARNDCSSWPMGQIHLTLCVFGRCRGVLPSGRSDAARRARARGSGQGGAWFGNARVLAAIKLRTRGPRPASGGRQQRSFPLVHGASTSDDARLATVKGRPPLREVGRGPARLRACHRARGALWLGFCAFLPTFNPAQQGRVRPREDTSDDCSPRFMGQVHPTSRVLERSEGVPPRMQVDRGPHGAA